MFIKILIKIVKHFIYNTSRKLINLRITKIYHIVYRKMNIDLLSKDEMSNTISNLEVVCRSQNETIVRQWEKTNELQISCPVPRAPSDNLTD